MKFVSRYVAPVITVNSGTQRAIILEGGATQFRDNGDMFNVQFEILTLTAAEIDAAKKQLFAGALGEKPAFGSTPSRDEGILNVDEGAAMGYADLNYEGYDIYQNLSLYDTNDPRMCPPQKRAEVEEFLLGHYEFGHSYVRVDNYDLTPPWPTYPKGVCAYADVARFAQVGGLLNEALAYEQASEQRPELLELYAEMLKVEVAKSEEDAALSARV